MIFPVEWRNLKKFRLDQESSPDLCDYRPSAPSIELIKATGETSSKYLQFLISIRETSHEKTFKGAGQGPYCFWAECVWFLVKSFQIAKTKLYWPARENIEDDSVDTIPSINDCLSRL